LPAEGCSEAYLVDGLATLARPLLPRAWSDGVRFFAHEFAWDGWPGLRLVAERRRLDSMTRAIARFKDAVPAQR